MIPRLLGRFQVADRLADWITDGALTALREQEAWHRADAADIRARLHLALTRANHPRPIPRPRCSGLSAELVCCGYHGVLGCQTTGASVERWTKRAQGSTT